MGQEQTSDNDSSDSVEGTKQLNHGEPTTAEHTDKDDPHKVEKLTKAGRDIDPDEGSD